ncbi:proepiregulin [Platysternon megacephalum]|uniref:Proepiregulin n=1 Tax=Platysternon megacephalum TaxID=55544 RepID=A0A4D9ECI8_9SAUR|nr:proepiregulin [Platysternon megacephalum]
MAAKLYVLISWPDGSRVINSENIKEPRKPFHLYTVGEQVLARCPGFSGLYWGVVEGISEHKDILEKRLQENRQLFEKLKEEPAVHSGLPSQPKKSRKTFPKWMPGSSSHKYNDDRSFYVKPLVKDEDAGLKHDAAVSSVLKERRILTSTTRSHCTMSAPYHSSTAFKSPSPFLSLAVPGTSQNEEARPGTATRDYITLTMKRKSDGILAKCQQHICTHRSKKIEQLERIIVDLQQEVLSLKRKVQRLESLSFQEEPHRQQCEVVELFNGYTKEHLKEAIRFDQKISTACKTLLYKLFTSDYIQSHSITGRRGNTFREAKPMMDERCIKIIRVLLKQKFGDHLSDTVITEKIQNVQKALRQKFKTECL